MKQRIFQVDAFTDRIFSGNPAAVCPLDHWPDDEWMQKVAMENNLAETAFYVKQGEEYHIRWFTPTVEVDLCGHATLASAYVLFFVENCETDTIRFFSPRSGKLTVDRRDKLLTMNFPADTFSPIGVSEDFIHLFDVAPEEIYKGKTDYMLVFADENQIRQINPNLDLISKLDARGVIVTAKGNSEDFVARFFAPQSGIDEDPVTGSAYTTLAPYWAKRLEKTNLTARQLSKRQGYIHCRHLGNRVEISGQCRLYMTGEICTE